MKPLLLACDVIEKACAGDASVMAVLDKLQAEGVRPWLYVGAVGILLERVDRVRLRALTGQCRWLAALAGEGEGILDSDDPLTEQHLRALCRLEPGARLLTTDETLLSDHPRETLSPDTLLQLDAARPAVPFIDLAAQQDLIRAGLEERIHRVLHHGQYILGPEVQALEERLAASVGVKHACSVANGTDALLMTLMALDIGPGDEVITVPYTWISTAEVIALLHARPVFVDVLPDTLNMDPDQIDAAVTSRTRAIMPVGLYGQCADMTRIRAVADRHGLPVIEDAAQCFGATHQGHKACALSLVGCTSFFPAKPLGAYGEGGAIFTDDDALAEKLFQIRVHGQKVKHQHPLLGLNGRLDSLQAAVLIEKLALFPEECRLRRAVASRYDRLLKDIPGITLPQVAAGNESVYAQYTIMVEGREALSRRLAAEDIPAVAYYAVPLHLQKVFAPLGYHAGDFPVAEKAAANGLSLPMSPYLDESVQERVAAALR